MQILRFKHYLAEVKRLKYEYSSTQINLPEELSKRIIKWGKKSIPNEDVFRDPSDPSFGREDEIHVTVLYGLHDTQPDEIREFLAKEAPIEVRLGDVTIFKSNDKFDVVKVDVFGPDLHRLNRSLRSNFRYTTNFPMYKPHVTIAYVRKGRADQFSGADVFKGEGFVANEIQFSSRNGDKTSIHLGVPKSQVAKGVEG
jgi:2'-5' RNA ligase